MWSNLGGVHADLVTVVENALLRMCGQGRLNLPGANEKVVVLHPFSGPGVCKQAFLGAGYTHVLESDTVTSRNMGPCVDDVQLPEAYDVSMTELCEVRESGCVRRAFVPAARSQGVMHSGI